MSGPFRRVSPALLVVTLLALVASLAMAEFFVPIRNALRIGGSSYDIGTMKLLHADLPRVAMALLCGAGLAASGAILQQVLRNPLASPSTLGVSAGARLALALASIFAPSLLGIGRDVVALTGSAVSTLLVFFLVRQRQFSPLSLVLAGLIVSLYCGALATILVLVKDRYLVGLFIWGSGSLSQISWHPAQDLALRLALCLPPLLLLLRSMSLLDLGDDAASGLGLSVRRIRALSVGLAVLLAAFVTSAVGVIGFVGLAAPILVRLCGARRFGARLIWSAITGALLLLATDLAIIVLAADDAPFLPTGAVTAILASPLLLALLPRLKLLMPAPLSGFTSAQPKRNVDIVRKRMIWVAALALAMILVLPLLGRAADGSWALLSLSQMAEILPWRLPRMLTAMGAGSLLAVAGYILQRVTGNPMASPEVMGVSAGAILGVAVLLAATGSLGSIDQTAAATLGAMGALALVLTLSANAPSAPERILLAGIALTALVDALIGVMTATGDPNAVMLLAWLSGSTNGANSLQAAVSMISAIIFLGAAMTCGG